MSVPVFLHFYSNGAVWISNEIVFTPHLNTVSSSKGGLETGTPIGIFRVNADAGAQKITTISGTVSSNLAVSGATGKYPTKEIT